MMDQKHMTTEEVKENFDKIYTGKNLLYHLIRFIICFAAAMGLMLVIALFSPHTALFCLYGGVMIYIFRHLLNRLIDAMYGYYLVRKKRKENGTL